MAERIQAIQERVDQLAIRPQGDVLRALLKDVPWLLAELQTARTLLQQVEWTKSTPDSQEPSCQFCLHFKGDKHAHDCELAAFLRGAEVSA